MTMKKASPAKVYSALYPVQRQWKFGFINSQGELVVVPQYDAIGRFAENRCSVEKVSADKTVVWSGYIDPDGAEIIELKPNALCLHFSEGLAQYGELTDGVGFIDSYGQFAIKPQFQLAVNDELSLGFSEGIAAVAQDNSWVYIDEHGNRIFDHHFSIAKRFQDGLALVGQPLAETSVRELHFITITGERLETIPCEISVTSLGFRDGRALVKPSAYNNTEPLNRFGFISPTGDLAFSKLFAYASGFHEGVSIVKESGKKYGVINRDGEYLLAPEYDEFGYFQAGLAPFKQDGKWGLVTITGEIILKPSYEYIDSFLGNLRYTDPFHHMEDRELTTAKVHDALLNRKISEVYINRNGEFVAEYEL